MEIKKLSKQELSEGLTLELVNAWNPERHYSPVMFQAGDEPAEILKCSKGYWVKDGPGQFIKNQDGSLMVFPEKECQIARARYVLNYGEKEKTDKVQQLVESWRGEVRKKIDGLDKEIGDAHSIGYGDSLALTLILALKEGAKEAEVREQYCERHKRLSELKQKAEEMYADGKIIELLEAFGLKKFSNPMLSVQKDDPVGVQVLKNVFGAKALQEWDGDILNRYAAIEIEKEYH